MWLKWVTWRFHAHEEEKRGRSRRLIAWLLWIDLGPPCRRFARAQMQMSIPPTSLLQGESNKNQRSQRWRPSVVREMAKFLFQACNCTEQLACSGNKMWGSLAKHCKWDQRNLLKPLPPIHNFNGCVYVSIANHLSNWWQSEKKWNSSWLGGYQWRSAQILTCWQQRHRMTQK